MQINCAQVSIEQFCECKQVSLALKTASGIKKRRDVEPGLTNCVKTRDSCQPEQAIEPQANDDGSCDTEGISAFQGGATKSTKLFVPARQASRRGK